LLSICIASYGNAQARSSNALYLSFEERVMISYLLLAAGESVEKQNEIIERASNYVLRAQEKGLRTIHVESFDEYLQQLRGEWPNAYTVESNLEIIENSEVRPFTRIISDVPQIQMQIEQYQIRRNEYISSHFHDLKSILQTLSHLLGNPTTMTGAAASAALLLPSAQAMFAEKSVDFIRGEFQKISSLGKDLMNRQGQKQQNDAFNIFITFALAEYFQNLSLDSQKQIISQILGEDLQADPIRKFEIMVLNSGPQFQKLLQVVAREASMPEDLLVIFKRLESLTMPVPKQLVEKLIQAETHNFDIQEFDIKPLGVGTMAQVHRGMIQTEKGPRRVVIRFLKPGIENRVAEDHSILQKLAPVLDSKPELAKAGFAKVGPLTEELTQTVMDELDLKGTIERQKLGRKTYNRKIHLDSLNREMLVRVPQIYDANTEDSKLMVQEMVTGMKLDELQRRHQVDMPNLKKEVTIKLAEVWLGALLFENGFYHSDLHQGNLMVDLGNRILPFNLLDFGMAGQLSPRERQYFLLMAAGGELNNAKMMAEAMYGISSQTRNEVDQKTFTKLMEDKMFDLREKKLVLSPERWIAWALNAGLRFSSDIIGVSRGVTIVDKLLKDADAGVSVLGVSRGLAKKYKWEVLSTLRSSENFRFLDYFMLGRIAVLGGLPTDNAPFEKPPVLAPMCRSVILAR
jgi:ubiquinone biosynthesis protein